MRYFRIAFIFSLMLMILAGCSKEEIQPDPLNAADSALKKAKVRKGPDHFVPFKASFELAGYFQHYGPICQIDEQDPWVFPECSLEPPPTTPPGMHIIIRGSGNATHLGKTEFEIIQWWTRAHPNPPPAETGFYSYGQGSITFTAANGDKLFATYWGWADHTDDTDGVEIETNGTFIGGTGRFEGAKGSFIWDGLFFKEFTPIPPNHETLPPTPKDTKFGTGAVEVSGSIMY